MLIIDNKKPFYLADGKETNHPWKSIIKPLK